MNSNPVDQSGPAAYNPTPEATPMLALQTTTPTARIRRPFFPAIRPGKEVQKEVKKPAQSVYRIKDLVTIREKTSPKLGKPYFELRYTDPATGHEVKRRLSGLELPEVRAVAEHLAKQAYQGKGYLAGQSKAPGIEEGIVSAIQLSSARDATKSDWIERAKPFLAYMGERFPSVKTWGDLKPSMVKGYILECERSGLAFDSVRHRLAPVKMAWRLMHQDHPELVLPMPKIKLAAPDRREIQCLNAGELVVLLDWLKAFASDLWPMATLQALCGLRMLEAAALRVQDMNLRDKTITVTDTGNDGHKPKNRHSYRTIPVCDEAVDALKTAMANQTVRPASGELFTNQKGNLWVKDALGLRWRRVLRHMAAKPERIERKATGKPLTLNPHGLDIPRLRTIPPHRLRAAFATMASRLGAQDRILKAYLGHSSGDMLGGHYRRIDMDELRQVSEIMDGWREAGKEGSARKQSGNNRTRAVAQA